jgi:hypothetical protein
MGGNEVSMGEIKKPHNIFDGNLKERGQFEDLDVDKRMTLEWIVKN